MSTNFVVKIPRVTVMITKSCVRSVTGDLVTKILNGCPELRKMKCYIVCIWEYEFLSSK